jgi:hypothetical protein
VDSLLLAPFMDFLRYGLANDTWTARGVIAALAAALPVDLSLAQVSGMRLVETPDPMLVDDLIWLNVGTGVLPGGGGAGSDIAFYRKATNAWTVRAGAGGARVGAPGPGTSLDFVPIFADGFVSIRGGGSNLVDKYVVATDSWEDLSPRPRTEVFVEGTETATSWERPDTLYVAHHGRIYAMRGGQMDTLETIDGDDGLAHKGLGLCAYKVGSADFLIVRPHGKQEVQRLQLVR